MSKMKFRAKYKDNDRWSVFTLQEILEKDREMFDNYHNWGQYTERKDKNNKEIYEGDIVKGYLTLVNNDVYDFQDVIEYHHYSFECPNNADFPLDQYDELEIIGNIYENPELIK